MIDNKYENFTDMLDEECEQEYLEEANKKINYGALEHQGRIFFGHLIKFDKQKQKQSRSWIKSVRNSSDAITDMILDEKGNPRGNVVNYITANIYKMYLLGVDLANHDAKTMLVNPKYATLPEGFDADFIQNKYRIGEWMYNRTDDYEMKNLIKGYFGYAGF